MTILVFQVLLFLLSRLGWSRKNSLFSKQQRASAACRQESTAVDHRFLLCVMGWISVSTLSKGFASSSRSHLTAEQRRLIYCFIGILIYIESGSFYCLMYSVICPYFIILQISFKESCQYCKRSLLLEKHSDGEARYQYHILSCTWIPVVSTEVLLKNQAQSANLINITSPAFQLFKSDQTRNSWAADWSHEVPVSSCSKPKFWPD